MAKVLVVISGLRGIYNASLELISRLEKEGHEVNLASPKQDLVLSNSSFGYHRLQPLLQESIIGISEDEEHKGIKGLLVKHWRKKARTKSAMDRIEPKDFRPLLDRLDPDLVIIDIEMHEYIFQTYTHNSRTILLCQFFSVWTNAYLPAITSSLNVSDGRILIGLRNRLHFLLLILKRNKANFLTHLFSGGLNRRRILKYLSKKWGFPFKFIGRNLWPGPILYNDLPVICMTLKSLDFPHKKRKNLHYVGPMVNLSRVDNKALPTNENSLSEILILARKRNQNILYCSLSTLQKGDSSFIEKVVKAVSQIDSWIMILSLGKAYKDYDLKSFPKSVYAFSFVPQLEVLKCADISINHGGIHVINECIALKVPMLVYSGKKADQNGNASRLKWHKAAYIGDKDLDTVDDIKQKIESLILDIELQKNLDAIQLKFRKTIRKALFEDFINSYIVTAKS